MSSFTNLGYEVVENALNKETCKLLDVQFELLKKRTYYYDKINESNVSAFRDTQVENGFSVYSPLIFDSLLLHLQPTMERVTGKKLLPSYTYARIYYKDADLKIHTDRPSCEYSATITLDIDKTPWEIFFKDFNGECKELVLNVGDMCAYQGTKLEHWRDPYKEDRQSQVFIHYVDAEGEYKKHIYDRRDYLGLDPATLPAMPLPLLRGWK